MGLPSPLSATTSLVRSPVLPTAPTSGLAALVQSLPEMLLRQFEYEDPIVRGGKHLLHSPFFKVSQRFVLRQKFLFKYHCSALNFSKTMF